MPILTVRLSSQISDGLRAAAGAKGLSVSGFARSAFISALPEGSAVSPLAPSPARRRATVPDADVAAVARLVGEVGRLTGATIQLAKALRERGNGLEHADTELLLKSLRAVQADLVMVVVRLRPRVAT